MIELLIFISMYFIGAIPSGYILVKTIKNVDLRTVGSRSIGATNAGRILGFKGFIYVFILDFMKSFLPLMIIAYIYGSSSIVTLISAIILVLGHTFSVFVNFKGGKGIATGVGVSVVLIPTLILVAFIIFIVLFLSFRMVSLASILAATSMGVLVLFTHEPVLLKVAVITISAYVVLKHRQNISRIINGTESKIKF